MALTKSEANLALARQNQDGRICNPDTIISQIGRMNVFAISGGKYITIKNAENETVGVMLPCGTNRAVEVVLNFWDLYTVRRVRLITSGANRGEVVVEETHENMYFDQVGEVAYTASCWR